MAKATKTQDNQDARDGMLRAILDHSPSIVLAIDDQYRIRFINRVPFGLDIEDVLGKSCLHHVPQEHHPTVQHAVEQVLATGKPASYEIQGRGPDDTIAWYATQVLPLPPEEGIARVLLMTNDISARRRLEDALLQGEALLRAIIEGTTDAVYAKDPEGRYMRVNHAAAALLGRNAEDILGRDDNQLFPPGDAGKMRTFDRTVLAQGTVSTLEEQVTFADGVRRTFLSTKGPLRDDAGKVFGLFGISRDITDVLHKEEAQRQALEESRHLLELALAGAELGTWDVALPQGDCHYDPRYCAMLGHGAGELGPTMEAWLHLIHPDDLAAVNAAMRSHLKGETRLYESEHRLRHKDGHWVWILARGKITYDENGEPARMTGTVLDISDRKRVATEGADLLHRIEALIQGLNTGAGAEGVPARSGASPGQPHIRLSPRSREVLGLLAAGLTAGEIAARLGISKETAMTHRRNLMRKLGLRNKAELIRYALQHGIGPQA